jgi:hypothetical protein
VLGSDYLHITTDGLPRLNALAAAGSDN